MVLVDAPTSQLGIEAGDQWLFKSSLLVTVTKLIEVSQHMTINHLN